MNEPIVWEYESRQASSREHGPIDVNALNKFGMDGWELVNAYDGTFYFKRRKILRHWNKIQTGAWETRHYDGEDVRMWKWWKMYDDGKKEEEWHTDGHIMDEEGFD